MKKVYIFLTAICLVALTGCIKEEAYELEQVSLQVSLDTRGATDSQQQGDKIEDVMLWAFKCTLDDDDLPVRAEATASGWRYVANVNTYQELANIHVPLDVCAKEDKPATQSYVLFAVINTKAFNPNFDLGRNTNYETLTKSVFTKNGAFWNTYPETSTPEVMPVSNWATFTVNTRDVKNEDGNITSSANTHNGHCYQLTLPVYRAVAKAQLSMRKASDNFDLKVVNAKIVSSAAPTNGAMFTKRDYGTSQHEGKETSATGATAFGYPNQTDGFNWWVTPSYGSSSPIQLCNFTNSDKIISYLPEDITVYDQGDNNVNGETAEEDEYQWVASTFLLENEKGNTTWNPTTPTAGGYCMEITYDITPEDTEDENKTECVWLPAVVRNHDYQIKATVQSGGGIAVNYTVADWVEVSWDLAFDAAQHTSLLPLPKDDAKPTTFPTISYTGDNEEGAAVFYFKMTGPVGITWKPTIFANEDDFEVRVYKVIGTDATGEPILDTKQTTGNIVAEGSAYYAVKVVAMKHTVATDYKSVRLGITHAPQWNEEKPNLLIINPKSNGNFLWPKRKVDANGDTTTTYTEGDEFYVEIYPES